MTHSFGLPANISISFRKLLWFCVVRNEIPPFPAGKEIVSGIQTLTKGSHKGSLQAHMEPCTASQQCVSHVPCAASLYQHCFTFPPYLCCFLAGSGREHIQSKMQLHINNSITVCNQLNYVSYTERSRQDSKNQTKLQRWIQKLL